MKDIDVLVLGSLNMDLIFKTEHNPRPGETVKSNEFNVSVGGKGNNQAVALGKMGARVVMAGCVGSDEYGSKLIENLKKNGVSCDGIEKIDDSSGLAFINVFSGQNTIILYEGANGHVRVDMLKYREELIKRSKILLTQLEIPYDTVKWALKAAKKYKTTTILNPAPAKILDDEVFHDTDIIVPNEIECRMILGLTDEEKTYEEIARMLLGKGIKNVVITLGDKGSFYTDNGKTYTYDAIDTDVVDTTGAGDAYIGALAYAISHDYDLSTSVKIATKVASVKISHLGAQNYDINLKDILRLNK